MSSLSSWTANQFDPKLDWGDARRFQDRWGGKLILKGILDPEDAVKAERAGVDTLVVSNHGGRQLDGARSSISAVPEIVDAVGSRMEVLMDGGICSGQDVLKALAFGPDRRRQVLHAGAPASLARGCAPGRCTSRSRTAPRLGWSGTGSTCRA